MLHYLVPAERTRPVITAWDPDPNSIGQEPQREGASPSRRPWAELLCRNADTGLVTWQLNTGPFVDNDLNGDEISPLCWLNEALDGSCWSCSAARPGSTSRRSARPSRPGRRGRRLMLPASARDDHAKQPPARRQAELALRLAHKHRALPFCANIS